MYVQRYKKYLDTAISIELKSIRELHSGRTINLSYYYYSKNELMSCCLRGAKVHKIYELCKKSKCVIQHFLLLSKNKAQTN